MTGHSLSSRLDWLCREAARDLDGAAGERLEAVRRRLASPLRIALVGRVKAGKSTLLNALVGERLAPTDAGECTRIVTWYRYAPGYEVRAIGRDGRTWEPAFRKGETAIEIDLGAPEEEVEHLELGWPSARLSAATLIDTPGLGSLSPDVSLRSRELFPLDEEQTSRVDVVIYLMRHAHAQDIAFLEGFRDAGLPFNTPVNTVAVLSRADEIGSGRLDALESAARVAARYEQDERVRSLAGSVLPVAGLLAETGSTLEEAEFAALRQVAALGAETGSLLLSVERFRDADRNPLAAELRERLLMRLGMFGLRFAVHLLQERHVSTANELAARLQQASGLGALRDLVARRFTSRSRQLVARSALLELQAIARDLRHQDSTGAAQLAAAVEELAASTHELAELELLHNMAVGTIRFSDAERAEAERLTAEGSVASRLGLPEGTSPSAQQSTVLEAIARWRQRAANPMTDRQTRQGCDVIVRSYEGLYASLAGA